MVSQIPTVTFTFFVRYLPDFVFFAVLTVIFAVPSFFPVILPDLLTDTIDGLELLNVTLLELLGVTFTLSFFVYAVVIFTLEETFSFAGFFAAA